MSKIDTGGPAFPTVSQNSTWETEDDGGSHHNYIDEGMTLRDWFAGQVLVGLANFNTPRFTTELAYEIADAMIVARSQ